jgi:hypothetical protein
MAASSGGTSPDEGGFAGDLPCDLMIHCMSYPPGAPPPPGGRSAAAMAGASAAALGAKELVLYQPHAAFVDSPEGADADFPARLIQQAREGLGSEAVSLAGCYWCYQPEREEEQLQGDP